MTPPHNTSPTRQLAGFAFAGGTAFLIDAGTLLALTEFVGLPPLIARFVAISLAMIVAWLINRTLSFKVGEPPSLKEFGRYASTAWLAAAINYAVFALLLWLKPDIGLIVAVAASTTIAMLFSFTGMRYFVFRKRVASADSGISARHQTRPPRKR